MCGLHSTFCSRRVSSDIAEIAGRTADTPLLPLLSAGRCGYVRTKVVLVFEGTHKPCSPKWLDHFSFSSKPVCAPKNQPVALLAEHTLSLSEFLRLPSKARCKSPNLAVCTRRVDYSRQVKDTHWAKESLGITRGAVWTISSSWNFFSWLSFRTVWQTSGQWPLSGLFCLPLESALLFVKISSRDQLWRSFSALRVSCFLTKRNFFTHFVYLATQRVLASQLFNSPPNSSLPELALSGLFEFPLSSASAPEGRLRIATSHGESFFNRERERELVQFGCIGSFVFKSLKHQQLFFTFFFLARFFQVKSFANLKMHFIWL